MACPQGLPVLTRQGWKPPQTDWSLLGDFLHFSTPEDAGAGPGDVVMEMEHGGEHPAAFGAPPHTQPGRPWECPQWDGAACLPQQG